MRIIFAGTPENAAQALRDLIKVHDVALVLTRQDAPVGRKKVLTESAVAQTAREFGLRIHKANRIAAAELEVIKDAGAQLGVIVAYGCILPEQALELLSWWNMHFSILPAWRGAAPLQHAIASGGQSAGVTIFKLDAGMDTGPILLQKSIAIRPNESTFKALPRFTRLGTELLLEAMETLPVPFAQAGNPSFAPKISRGDAKLDFSRSAFELANKVAAHNPEPMAWGQLGQNQVRIISARAIQSTNELATEAFGQVFVKEKSVLVGCGDSYLELLEVQPAGKNQMRAADWQRGIDEGARFD